MAKYKYSIKRYSSQSNLGPCLRLSRTEISQKALQAPETSLQPRTLATKKLVSNHFNSAVISQKGKDGVDSYNVLSIYYAPGSRQSCTCPRSIFGPISWIRKSRLR